MDLQPDGDHFIQPDAEMRDQKIRYAQSVKKSAEVVLKRLQAKEFKKPAEVERALGEELQKTYPANGPIDRGDR